MRASHAESGLKVRIAGGRVSDAVMRSAASHARACLLAVMLVVIAAAACTRASAQSLDQASDAHRVQDDRAVSVGRWEVASVEVNGRPVDPELVAMLQVVYQADGSWSVLFKSLTVADGRSTHRQDLSPKTFEMETLGSESMKPIRYTGIYKLDGATRLLCFVPDGKPRPDAFVSPRRSGRILVTLRRPADSASR